ncbi:histone acetyltransferase subunit NuA4-domain-containing protein [Haematococcus lacustris]
MREAKRKAQPAPRDGTASVDAVGLEERLRHTRKQLLDVEKQIYNLETQYLENANVQGNALRGYEGLLSSSTMNAKKAQLKAEDRISSGSSVSGPVQHS